MKALKLLLVVIIFLISSNPCFAERKVELNGDWDGRKKSIVQELPLKASIEDSSKELSLQFFENLGTVYVTVINASGEIVYNQSVETEAVSSFVIHLDSVEKGEYMLSVTDGANEVHGQIIIH